MATLDDFRGADWAIAAEVSPDGPPTAAGLERCRRCDHERRFHDPCSACDVADRCAAFVEERD